MERRDFLRAGALAWAGLSVVRPAAAETPGSDAAGFPTVISTWGFGELANREAVKRLEEGQSVLDAVQHGVMLVEADPKVTSVGFGGFPNREGVVELDAALMDGLELDAGSVAALRDIKHPVAVARKVMTDTPHVLLVGDGARRFALQHGFEAEELLTEESRTAWERWRASIEPAPPGHDTIGTVARDATGRMAAACTTSGLAFKLPGRVGDSPLIGHGLYCDDEAGGAVATGVGEEVIRVCGAYQAVESMRAGVEPAVAVRRVLHRILRRHRGAEPPMVGLAALRADGEVGYASTLPGFRVALARQGKHRLLDAPSLVAPPVGAAAG